MNVSGPYLQKVTKAMLDFTTGTLNDERKIYLYSGHESNIAGVLYALNVNYPHIPEYSSSVILELHQIDNEYYVQVRQSFDLYKMYSSFFFFY